MMGWVVRWPQPSIGSLYEGGPTIKNSIERQLWMGWWEIPDKRSFIGNNSRHPQVSVLTHYVQHFKNAVVYINLFTLFNKICVSNFSCIWYFYLLIFQKTGWVISYFNSLYLTHFYLLIFQKTGWVMKYFNSLSNCIQLGMVSFWWPLN